MRRIVVLFGAIAVVAIAVVVLVLYSSLDSIVEDAIEHYGSQITGTAVRVGSVKISPSSGRGTLRGLRVANPKGFSSGDAFRLGEISVQLEIRSLTGNPVVVEEVRIEAPEVNYELGPKGQSNIDVIRKHVEGYQGSASGEADSPGSRGREEPPTRLAIRKFTFESGRIEVDASAMAGKAATLELPSLRLTNLGGRNGATPDRIGKTVMVALGQKVTKAVASKGLKRVLEGKLTGEAGEAAQGLLKKLLD